MEVITIALVALVALVVYMIYNQRKPGLTPFLDGSRQTVTLIDKMEISHDVRRFRLGLPSSTMMLGLPPGKHIQVFAPAATGAVAGQWNGKEDHEATSTEVVRKYTPTTCDHDAPGYVDLVIKVYRRHGLPGGLPQFPDGGKVSQWLDSLKINDPVTIKGPVGLHQYVGDGVFKDGRREVTGRQIGMIAGGTGITPMLQIMKTILENPKDGFPKLWLLYANQTENDILLRKRLEAYEEEYQGRFKLWYTLDRPPANWSFDKGFVNEDMIDKHLPKAGDDTVVLCCGPPPMIEYACKPNLAKLGHDKHRIICF